MLSKLIRCTENCNSCSQHWSTERAQFFSRTMPSCMSYSQSFKSWRIGLQRFASPSMFTWPLTNHHSFKHFDNVLQGKCLHNQEEAENAFQNFVESWSMDFHATGINKLISHWQKKKKVLIVMVPILIDKYLFEPSYHALKGFPGSSVSEESACKAGDARNANSVPG